MIKRKISMPVWLVLLILSLVNCTCLYSNETDFVIVDQEDSTTTDKDAVVVTDKKQISSSAAYEDPDEITITNQDLSTVNNVITYTPHDDKNTQIFYFPANKVHVPNLYNKRTTLKLNLPSVNISSSIHNTFRTPWINNTYVVRRYVPARKTYVYHTVHRPIHHNFNRHSHHKAFRPPQKPHWGPRRMHKKPPRINNIHKKRPKKTMSKPRIR